MQHWWKSIRLRETIPVIGLLVGFFALVAVLWPTPAEAAQTTPYTVNFQGRLADQNGNILPNGSYNIKFRLWTGLSGGSNVWQEDRVYGGADNRVVVTNGLFNVQLGTVNTTLSPSLFSTGASPLYLEVELPTPATATCATNACGSYTEGAMTPRQPLAAAPYAFNADAVDGIDGASLVQLSPSGQQTGSINVSSTITSGSTVTATGATLTGALALSLGSTSNVGSILFQDGTGNNRTITLNATAITATYSLTLPSTGPGTSKCLSSGAVTAGLLTWVTCGDAFLASANLFTNTNTVKATSTTAFRVQDASLNDALTVDTSTSTVTIGNGSNGITLGLTGVNAYGTARGTKTVTLIPEYPGATFTGDGSNNTGSLSSDFCSSASLMSINTTACNNTTDEHNYYAWANTQVAAQDYDLYVRYRIPADYSTGSMTNLKLWAWGTTTASEIASIALHKASGTACSSVTNAVTANATWAESTVASPLGSCSISAGDYVTFKLKLTAGQNNTVRAGEINFTYRSTF